MSEDAKSEMATVLRALDTAAGCLDLVAMNRRPVDLNECQQEIREAIDLVETWLDVAKDERS